MPGSLSEWAALMPSIGAVILTAVAVKWLDTWIDEEDSAVSARGGAAYSMLALLMASSLDLPLTIALFSACYAVGMLSDMRFILPSGLPGWLETVIALAFASVKSGLLTAFWAVLVIYSVQLIDDLLDYGVDRQMGITNLVSKLGPERSLILFVFCFYICVMVKPLLSVIVFAAALTVGNALFGQVEEGKASAQPGNV